MTHVFKTTDFFLDENEFLSDLSEVYLSEDNLVNNYQFINDFNVISLNIRSLNANHNELCILLEKFGNKKPHVIGLQETFKISPQSEALLNIPNYNLTYCSREIFQGGGVCFFIRNDLKFDKLFNLFEMQEGIFEAIVIDVTFRNEIIRLGNFYRSEKKLNNIKSIEKFDFFCNLYDDWITRFADTENKCMILTDSNINHLNKSDQRYEKFQEISFCSGFIPAFKLPTRFNPNGNNSLIDNIYTNHLDVRYPYQCTESFSDHNILSLSIMTNSKSDPPVLENISKKRSFLPKNIKEFQKILNVINWNFMDKLDTESSACFFNKVFILAYEVSFPLKKIKTTSKKKTLPFFNEKLDRMRMEKNRYYTMYKRDPKPANLIAYKSIRNRYTSLLRKLKREHLNSTFESLKKKPKELWQFIGKNTGLTNASKRKKSNIEFIHADGEIKDSPIEKIWGVFYI